MRSWRSRPQTLIFRVWFSGPPPKAAASVRSIANATRNRMHQGEHLDMLDLDSTDHFNLVGRLARSRAPQRTERTNDMNDKNDLLLIEAMDLITRASGMIDLLRTEERLCPPSAPLRQREVFK
jgi:hypothetical protein